MINFAYPSLAQPTALVSIPDVEQLPRSRPVRKYQQSFITDAGNEVIYDFGGSIEVFTMQLSGLSKLNADALLVFFNAPAPHGVNGRAGLFELQNQDGSVDTVRLAQDVLEAQQISVSWYDMAITMRII